MGRLSDKLTDLDFAILKALPTEGARHGNHTLAKQVMALKEEIPDATAAQLQGRLRSMRHSGLAISVVVQPVGIGRGWQRTKRGVEVLQQRRDSMLRVLPGGENNKEVQHGAA